MNAGNSEPGGETKVPRPPRRPVLILTACFILLFLLGWVDYLTGYELGFFVFYSAPVGLAGWYLGRWPGIAVALGATVTWFLADAFAGAKYSSHFSFWWNSTVHFAAFVINAVTIAKIRLELDRRDALAAELKSIRQALRVTANVSPVCPTCGKTHRTIAPSDLAEFRNLSRHNPELDAVICAECRSLKASEHLPPL